MNTAALQSGLAALAVFGVCLLPLSAQAQARAYPERSVRVVVPAPPGSAPDLQSRLIGQKLTEIWGQPVVIENIVGASGNIGTERAARAAPDGYTLLFNTIGPIAVNVSLFAKLPYDPLKDLVPITLVTKTPNLVTVHPSLPIKSVAEMIAMAKKEPGRLRYGTPGPGTTQHLSGELLNTLVNIKLVNIPYKSSAQMTTDGIAGQIEVMFHNAPVVLPHVKSGALRGLAITGATRSPLVPDLPTMEEAGVPGFEISAWFGFMAPAGTPQAVIQKVHADVVRIVASADVRERFLAQLAEPVGNRPEEYAAFINAEIVKWRAVVKQANMKVE